MSEASAADVDRSSTIQSGVVVAGITGALLAGVQVIIAVGHVLALGVGHDSANDAASSAGPSTGQVLRAVGLASSNVVLACVCLLAVAVAVRHGRAGRVPWVSASWPSWRRSRLSA